MNSERRQRRDGESSISARSAVVLVIDDDPEDLAAACSALGTHYLVLAATTGEDLVAKAAKLIHQPSGG